jgi:hypothetical protein
MNVQEQESLQTTDSPFRVGTAVLFIFQLLIFFLYYNFSANMYLIGLGWLFLIIGLILVLISGRKDSKVKERFNKLDKYGIHIGWSTISVSLALITQWITSVITVLLVCLMILDIRRIQSLT